MRQTYEMHQAQIKRELRLEVDNLKHKITQLNMEVDNLVSERNHLRAENERMKIALTQSIVALKYWFDSKANPEILAQKAEYAIKLSQKALEGRE